MEWAAREALSWTDNILSGGGGGDSLSKPERYVPPPPPPPPPTQDTRVAIFGRG